MKKKTTDIKETAYVRKAKTDISELAKKYEKSGEEELSAKLKSERDPNEFGLLLEYMRKTYLSLSQTDLAARINISRSHYINIEAGRALPSAKLRNRILHVFNVKFGKEEEDLGDALFYANNPNASQNMDALQLKRIYDIIQSEGARQPENTENISSPANNSLDENNVSFNQWVEPLQELRGRFSMDPPVTDKNGCKYRNLKSYYYEMQDEESEIAKYGDCLIINPDKKYGQKDEVFLLEDKTKHNRFIGRLYININDKGFPEAIVTIIHSYAYKEHFPKKPIEEVFNMPCDCLGQIVHTKRDLNVLSLDFLDDKKK